MNINIGSINTNGLNTEIKQELLHQFIIQHKSDFTVKTEIILTAQKYFIAFFLTILQFILMCP